MPYMDEEVMLDHDEATEMQAHLPVLSWRLVFFQYCVSSWLLAILLSQQLKSNIKENSKVVHVFLLYQNS